MFIKRLIVCRSYNLVVVEVVVVVYEHVDEVAEDRGVVEKYCLTSLVSQSGFHPGPNSFGKKRNADMKGPTASFLVLSTTKSWPVLFACRWPVADG